MMRTLRGRLLPLGAGLVVMCGTAGVAQAATPNVRTAIKTQDRIIRRSPEYAKLKNINVQTPAEAAPVIKALGALHASLEHAATVVSKSSTTSARQRTGRGEWVAAARQLAHGLSQLQAALRDVEHGNKAGAKTMLTKSDRTLAAASVAGTRADKLLGLPKSD